jgi:hypothetical protein
VAKSQRIGDIKIELSGFKADAWRLLPHDHPLNRILRKVPDRIPAAELACRIPDWLELLEGA